MWIPLGVVVAALVLRQPEPRRGHQDLAFHDALEAAAIEQVDAVDVARSARLVLPAPVRVGTLDYDTATTGQVWGELRRIRTMWFGVMAITIGQFLLIGLQAWGIDFFKQAHGMSAKAAGGYAALVGAGAGIGIVGGGIVADRLLRRGIVNARVLVVAVASVAAAIVLVPAVLVESPVTSGVLFLFGGLFLTLPVAPAEALVSDVVVAELRGRAASVRSVVRSASALSPLVIGMISDRSDLRTALAVVTPVYALGGLVMLLAARSYPTDLAFVAAEAQRTARAVEVTA
jgi:MFS family permease